MLIASVLAIAGVALPWWTHSQEENGYNMEASISLWEMSTKVSMTLMGQETAAHEESSDVCTEDSSTPIKCDKIRTIRAFAILTVLFGILSTLCVIVPKKSMIVAVGAASAAAFVVFALLAIIVAATLEADPMSMDGAGFILHIIALVLSMVGVIVAILAVRAAKQTPKKGGEDTPAESVPGGKSAEESGAPMKSNAEDSTFDVDMEVDVDVARPPVEDRRIVCTGVSEVQDV